MKRRLLKILLVTLAVVAFTGYFAFSTFLFSPTEGDFEADVSSLVPRDVDFFAAKADLARDFDPFPVPAFADELAATKGGKAFLESPEWADLKQALGLDAALQGLRDALGRAPVDVEPLGVLGGRDLAVAGYFRPAAPDGVDWAVYARGNWMAKLGLALLARPGLMDLEASGLAVAKDGDVLSLSGPGLPRTLHVGRLRDVVVLSTDPVLVRSAFDLADAKGEDSFGGSARYFDFIQQRARTDDGLELFVDYLNLAEARKLSGRWPDPGSQDFLPAFLARLFQLGSLKEAAGVVDFDAGVTASLHADLSSELVSAFQKVLYRQRGFERERLFQAARFAPGDAALAVYLHAPLGALLRQVLQALEPAARDNVNDLVRQVWRFPDADQLVDELDAAFHDRALLVLRDNDYPPDTDGPPNDGAPVFAWAVVLWTDQASKIEDVRRKVIDNQGLFGISGRKPTEGGVYTNEASGGQLIYEYWSAFLPGTGHLASVTDEGQGYFILSNHHRMLGHLLKTWFEGGASYPRLSENPRFEGLVATGPAQANLALWASPGKAAATLRRMADRAAEIEALDELDWATMRPQIDRRVLREHFPDWSYERLTEDQRQELEVLAGPERDRYQRERLDAVVPQKRARYERSILYASEVSALLLELALDPKSIDLHLRALLGQTP